MLNVDEHFVPNDDGWLLHLERATVPSALNRRLRPLAIVPGYGMNGFIFGYHPRGLSMRHALARAGFEVWTLNLRAQGASRALGKHSPPATLRALAEVDLLAAVHAVRQRTDTTASAVDLIGCSLGGTLAYGLVALRPDAPIGAVAAVGSPLRWVDPHLALRLATASPRLAGMVRTRGTRRAAELALPALTRVPSILSLYMNPAHVDLSAAAELVKTVEDPSPRVNREIAAWVQRRDLILRGVNVTEGVGKATMPLLVVKANRDGIVPAATALSARDAWGADVDVLEVGDDPGWYAHADLFVGDHAERDVFAPLAAWFERKNSA